MPTDNCAPPPKAVYPPDAGHSPDSGHPPDAVYSPDAGHLVDSHCHPHFPPLGEDADKVVETMRAHGVFRALAIATTLGEAATVSRLAAAYPGVFYAACGIHPTTDEDADAATLTQLCADKSVLAVGETGLDFFRDGVPAATQRRRFAAHIAAAVALNKPLVIHTRDSLDATLDMLRSEDAGRAGGVLHCYTGDMDGVRRALDINFMVSFSGIVAFKNAHTLREVARFVPSAHYLVETDAPYLAPPPHRGKINQPGYVRYVAAAVAQARNCPETQIAAETTANFNRLFRPPPHAAVQGDETELPAK